MKYVNNKVENLKIANIGGGSRGGGGASGAEEQRAARYC